MLSIAMILEFGLEKNLILFPKLYGSISRVVAKVVYVVLAGFLLINEVIQASSYQKSIYIMGVKHELFLFQVPKNFSSYQITVKEMVGFSKELLAWLDNMNSAIDMQHAFDVIGVLPDVLSGGVVRYEDCVIFNIDRY